MTNKDSALAANQRGCSRSKNFLYWQSALVLLFFVSLNLRAQSEPTAQQLFAAAHRQSDVMSMGPYKLAADVIVIPLDNQGRPDPKKQQTGKLTIFRDHDRARFEAQMGGESETQIQIGAIRYIDPKSGLLPALKLEDFDQSWDPERAKPGFPPSRYRLGDPSLAKTNGKDQLCVLKINVGSPRDTLCFDPEAGVLLSAGGFQFFDYRKIGSFQFPQRVEITRPEMPPVEVANIEITPGTLEADLFRIPETMLAVEGCPDFKFAKPVYTPEPDFPEAARKHKQQATVHISLIIGTDGKILRARALNETSYEMGPAATKKVSTWKFKPATCGTRPVNSAMDIEIGFHLY
jgi:TonB family protein